MSNHPPAPQRWQGPCRSAPGCNSGNDAFALLCRIAARTHDPDAPQWDFELSELEEMMRWPPPRLDAAICRAVAEGLLDQRTGMPGDRVVYSLAEEE